MEVTLNVKDKSVHTFLEERLIGYKPNERNGMNNFADNSAYYLMKDEMFFKKDCGIKVGEAVKIELLDMSQWSGKELKNIYLYRASEYDDVSIKMTLELFTIKSLNED